MGLLFFMLSGKKTLIIYDLHRYLSMCKHLKGGSMSQLNIKDFLYIKINNKQYKINDNRGINVTSGNKLVYLLLNDLLYQDDTIRSYLDISTTTIDVIKILDKTHIKTKHTEDLINYLNSYYRQILYTVVYVSPDMEKLPAPCVMDIDSMVNAYIDDKTPYRLLIFDKDTNVLEYISDLIKLPRNMNDNKNHYYDGTIKLPDSNIDDTKDAIKMLDNLWITNNKEVTDTNKEYIMNPKYDNDNHLYRRISNNQLYDYSVLPDSMIDKNNYIFSENINNTGNNSLEEVGGLKIYPDEGNLTIDVVNTYKYVHSKLEPTDKADYHAIIPYRDEEDIKKHNVIFPPENYKTRFKVYSFNDTWYTTLTDINNVIPKEYTRPDTSLFFVHRYDTEIYIQNKLKNTSGKDDYNTSKYKSLENDYLYNNQVMLAGKSSNMYYYYFYNPNINNRRFLFFYDKYDFTEDDSKHINGKNIFFKNENAIILDKDKITYKELYDIAKQYYPDKEINMFKIKVMNFLDPLCNYGIRTWEILEHLTEEVIITEADTEPIKLSSDDKSIWPLLIIPDYKKSVLDKSQVNIIVSTRRKEDNPEQTYESSIKGIVKIIRDNKGCPIALDLTKVKDNPYVFEGFELYTDDNNRQSTFLSAEHHNLNRPKLFSIRINLKGNFTTRDITDSVFYFDYSNEDKWTNLCGPANIVQLDKLLVDKYKDKLNDIKFIESFIDSLDINLYYYDTGYYHYIFTIEKGIVHDIKHNSDNYVYPMFGTDYMEIDHVDNSLSRLLASYKKQAQAKGVYNPKWNKITFHRKGYLSRMKFILGNEDQQALESYNNLIFWYTYIINKGADKNIQNKGNEYNLKIRRKYLDSNNIEQYEEVSATIDEYLAAKPEDRVNDILLLTDYLPVVGQMLYFDNVAISAGIDTSQTTFIQFTIEEYEGYDITPDGERCELIPKLKSTRTINIPVHTKNGKTVLNHKEAINIIKKNIDKDYIINEVQIGKIIYKDLSNIGDVTSDPKDGTDYNVKIKSKSKITIIKLDTVHFYESYTYNNTPTEFSIDLRLLSEYHTISKDFDSIWNYISTYLKNQTGDQLGNKDYIMLRNGFTLYTEQHMLEVKNNIKNDNKIFFKYNPIKIEPIDVFKIRYPENLNSVTYMEDYYRNPEETIKEVIRQKLMNPDNGFITDDNDILYMIPYYGFMPYFVDVTDFRIKEINGKYQDYAISDIQNNINAIYKPELGIRSYYNYMQDRYKPEYKYIELIVSFYELREQVQKWIDSLNDDLNPKEIDSKICYASIVQTQRIELDHSTGKFINKEYLYLPSDIEKIMEKLNDTSTNIAKFKLDENGYVVPEDRDLSILFYVNRGYFYNILGKINYGNYGDNPYNFNKAQYKILKSGNLILGTGGKPIRSILEHKPSDDIYKQMMNNLSSVITNDIDANEPYSSMPHKKLFMLDTPPKSVPNNRVKYVSSDNSQYYNLSNVDGNFLEDRLLLDRSSNKKMDKMDFISSFSSYHPIYLLYTDETYLDPKKVSSAIIRAREIDYYTYNLESNDLHYLLYHIKDKTYSEGILNLDNKKYRPKDALDFAYKTYPKDKYITHIINNYYSKDDKLLMDDAIDNVPLNWGDSYDRPRIELYGDKSVLELMMFNKEHRALVAIKKVDVKSENNIGYDYLNGFKWDSTHTTYKEMYDKIKDYYDDADSINTIEFYHAGHRKNASDMVRVSSDKINGNKKAILIPKKIKPDLVLTKGDDKSYEIPTNETYDHVLVYAYFDETSMNNVFNGFAPTVNPVNTNDTEITIGSLGPISEYISNELIAKNEYIGIKILDDDMKVVIEVNRIEKLNYDNTYNIQLKNNLEGKVYHIQFIYNKNNHTFVSQTWTFKVNEYIEPKPPTPPTPEPDPGEGGLVLKTDIKGKLKWVQHKETKLWYPIKLVKKITWKIENAEYSIDGYTMSQDLRTTDINHIEKLVSFYGGWKEYISENDTIQLICLPSCIYSTGHVAINQIIEFYDGTIDEKRNELSSDFGVSQYVKYIKDLFNKLSDKKTDNINFIDSNFMFIKKYNKNNPNKPSYSLVILGLFDTCNTYLIREFDQNGYPFNDYIAYNDFFKDYNKKKMELETELEKEFQYNPNMLGIYDHVLTINSETGRIVTNTYKPKGHSHFAVQTECDGQDFDNN